MGDDILQMIVCLRDGKEAVEHLKARYPEEASNVALDIKAMLGELALCIIRNYCLKPRNMPVPFRGKLLCIRRIDVDVLRVVILRSSLNILSKRCPHRSDLLTHTEAQ
jgi:hypothetical protein